MKRIHLFLVLVLGSSFIGLGQNGLEQFNPTYLSDLGKRLIQAKLVKGRFGGQAFLEVSNRTLLIDTSQLILYNCEYEYRKCSNKKNRGLSLRFILSTSLDTLRSNRNAQIVAVQIPTWPDQDTMSVSAGLMYGIEDPKCYLLGISETIPASVGQETDSLSK